MKVSQLVHLMPERWFCAYCGKDLRIYPKRFRTWDHVTPLSRGGAHLTENIVAACVTCNTRKSADPLVVFLAKTRWLKLCGVNRADARHTPFPCSICGGLVTFSKGGRRLRDHPKMENGQRQTHVCQRAAA